MPAVFIDGEAGTTGLGIRERLAGEGRVRLIHVPEAHRKSEASRRDAYAEADVVILCLPDDAARDAVSMMGDTRVIDASTAHRCVEAWVYGFAEMAPGQGRAIAGAARVANPGCYATGAIALLRPLVGGGALPASFPVTINAVSGYTGGGRALIEAHERDGGPAFELYSLMNLHKHVPEIVANSLLSGPPVFVPSVGHFPRGMTVSVPLHRALLPDGVTAVRLHAALSDWYAGAPNIEVTLGRERVRADALAGTDQMALGVHEAGAHVVLTATLDNLGKGASGAAVQNLRLMLGIGDG